jgi:hypothetical protein
MNHLIGLRFFVLISIMGCVEICWLDNVKSQAKFKPDVDVVNTTQKEFKDDQVPQ